MFVRRLVLLLCAVGALCLPFASRAAEEKFFQRGMERACFFAAYPTRGEVRVKCDFSRKNVRRTEVAELGKTFTWATVQVFRAGNANPLAETTFIIKGGQSDEKSLPVDLTPAKYEIRYTLNGPAQRVVSRIFERKAFPWEGNTLGITDEVFPPFTPVRAKGNTVDVVDRKMTMNNFGLWDSLISLYGEMLAAPMTLRYETAGGAGTWDAGSVMLEANSPARAAFAAECSAGPVKVRTRSTIEMDGCMKVEMTLLPGEKPREIRNLWLEIPLKASETPLFHNVGDTLRGNYSGSTPASWDSRQSLRNAGKWLNPFTSYLWLGGEERGLCWFAENDKNWVTKKDMDSPLQEFKKQGDVVMLRINFINKPYTFQPGDARTIVFGLQASPTKPMPDDWRRKGFSMPGGSGPVDAWGSINCSYKGPYNGDWQVVDKVIEAQKTGKFDDAWFANFDANNNPPPVYGFIDWIKHQQEFAGFKQRPALTYMEEQLTSVFQDDFLTYQDEWSMQPFTNHMWPDDKAARPGIDTYIDSLINYCRSYQDYAIWTNDQYLKRGVGPYFDNVFPHVSTNTLNTAAYVSETGETQPAIPYWNWREYQKRYWNRLHYWRVRQPEPLEWSNHMTNTLILPIHTWGTITLDFELNSTSPYTPEVIRAEAMGRQVGCYSYFLYTPYGTQNPVMNTVSEAKRACIDWGMRMVHESLRSGYPGYDRAKAESKSEWAKMEMIVRDFGYGDPAVKVQNYWDDMPNLNVSDPNVKWLMLKKNPDEYLIVLQSYAAADTTPEISFRLNKPGEVTPPSFTDMVTGENLPAENGTCKPLLSGPYGVRIIKMYWPQ